MTISIAWIRRNKGTTELLMASDSRLRSRGAIDQCQKLFPLARGDGCLAFCGDTQIAYPLFMQAGSALENFLSTRTRAKDITEIAHQIKEILNRLVSSWDLPKSEKREELKESKILFGGWSWRHQRFDLGVYKFVNDVYEFHRQRFRPGHPWREERASIVVIGDYEEKYRKALRDLLQKDFPRIGNAHDVITVNFDYQPVEALNNLLKTAERKGLHRIGGAPQMVKIYPYGNILPFIVRTGAKGHFLHGRRLFSWEKSERPILDLTRGRARFRQPLAHIPLPSKVTRLQDV